MIAKTGCIDPYTAVGKQQFPCPAHTAWLLFFGHFNNCKHPGLAKCYEQICSRVVGVETAILYRLVFYGYFYFASMVKAFIKLVVRNISSNSGFRKMSLSKKFLVEIKIPFIKFYTL